MRRQAVFSILQGFDESTIQDWQRRTGRQAEGLAAPAAVPAPKRNKYAAKKVVTEEGTFDSRMEYKRWCQLRKMQRVGEIAELERQIVFEFIVNEVRIGKFTADHRYLDLSTGQVVVEDVKGVLVRDVGLRLRLMKALHGIEVKLWPERKRKSRRKTTEVKP